MNGKAHRPLNLADCSERADRAVPVSIFYRAGGEAHSQA